MLETLKMIYQVFIPPGQRARWVGLIFLGVAVAVAETLTALLIFRVLDHVADPRPADVIELPLGLETTLVPLLLVAGAVFVARGLLSILSLYAQARVVHNAAATVSALVHRRYLQAPYRFHLTRSSSESLRTVLWSVDVTVNSALNPAISVVTAGLTAGMLFVLLLGIAPVMTLAAVGVLAVGLALVLTVVQPRLSRLGRKSEKTSQLMLAAVRDSFDSVRDIKAYRAEDYFDTRFRRHRSYLARLRSDRALLDQLPPNMVESIVVLGLLVLIGLAQTGSSFNDLVPVLGAFGYAALRIVPSVNKMVASVNKLRFGQQAARNVWDDLHLAIPQAPPDELAPEDLGPLLEREIELEQISFTYPAGERPALDGVDLTIRRGEMLAIAGGSGSGKSTLVDVVLGLLEPDSGRILIDGIDTPPPGWHQKVGIVSQTVVLLDSTVRDNVAFGDAVNADDELVTRALKLAQLGPWLEGLPDGLDTLVGESGKLVSGGERQRIAIARSLYRSPDLLILDEATSALDGATEASLVEGLAEFSGDLTIVIVSHRIAPIRAADRIAMMYDGKVVAVGSFDELRSSTPEFRDLVGM